MKILQIVVAIAITRFIDPKEDIDADVKTEAVENVRFAKINTNSLQKR